MGFQLLQLPLGPLLIISASTVMRLSQGYVDDAAEKEVIRYGCPMKVVSLERRRGGDKNSVLYCDLGSLWPFLCNPIFFLPAVTFWLER